MMISWKSGISSAWIICSILINISYGLNCLFSSFNGHCFKLTSKSSAFRSVYEARQMCLNDGWDLVAISSQEENYFIAQLISNSSNTSEIPSQAYIGLSDVDEAKNFTWMNGASVTYTNFSDSSENSYFYGDDRRCFAISSTLKSWQTIDLEWIVVPCCFPYQGIRYAVCSDYSIGSKGINTLQTYCNGNCSSDWTKYKNNCYLLVQSLGGISNATQSRRDCLDKNSDMISYSTDNQLFINFMVSSMVDYKNTSIIQFYLGFSKIQKPPNFDGTDISPYLSTAPDVLYQNNDQTRNCLVFWSKSDKSEEPCCVNLPVEWIACQKPETSSVYVDLDSDVLAKECYQSIDECVSNPCQNGGTCLDHVLYYECTCPSGFEGSNCEITTNPCLPYPCENNGTCIVTSSNTHYNCSCFYGYNGTNCEIQWNQCLSNPCQNNGNCVPQTSPSNTFTYNCICQASTSGTNCETDTIDECSSNPCKMGSTCLNLINKFKCDCLPGNTGILCDEVVACANLTSLVDNANEIKVTGSGVSYGDLRSFECHENFQFSDITSEKTVICAADNHWNDSAVLMGCQESCAFLPVVHNSSIVNASTAVNTSSVFQCITGHVIEGSITEITFTCLPDRSWYPDTTSIACQPRRCPVLPKYHNQYLDRSDDIYGTTVKVWCDIGYQFFDNTTARTLRCKANGDWTATLPPCDPTTCPELPLSDHMSRNTSATGYLSYVTYTCDPKYRMLDGSQYKVILCDAMGEWSDDITDCKRERCFPLPYVANATPSTTNATYWTQSTLRCISGHKFKTISAEFSNAIMTCQENGWWSPILTACEPIFCPELSISDKNITRDTESRLYDTVVKFKCLKGYYIDANTFLDTLFISCQDTQEWNDTSIPTCQPIRCPDPPATPVNGVRSMLTSTFHFYPEMVSYSCNQGTKFIDGQKSKNIVCNEVGVWNETDVSCKSERCEPVIIMPNSYPDTTNTSWYVTVTYYCNKGYYRMDGLPFYAIKCEAGGVWNDTYDALKDCKIKTCPPVEIFPNSNVNSTSVTFYGTTLQYKCSTGYKYIDNNSTIKYRKCNEDATWIPKNFSGCQITHCPVLPNVNNTTQSSNETFYNVNINFTCLPGFQFPDKSKVQVVICTENETWTNLPSPCDVIFCPPLPSWSETIFNTTDNNFDSSVEFYCKEGAAFKSHKDEPGNRTILFSRCIPNKQWMPPIETCYTLAAINADIKGKSWESPNAASLGSVACAIMAIVVAGVFFLDLRKVLMDFNMMRNNVKTYIQFQKANKIKPEN